MYVHVSNLLDIIALACEHLSPTIIFDLSSNAIRKQRDVAAYAIVIFPVRELDHSNATSEDCVVLDPLVCLFDGMFDQPSAISYRRTAQPRL